MSHHDSLRLPPLAPSRQTSTFNYILPSISSNNPSQLPSQTIPIRIVRTTQQQQQQQQQHILQPIKTTIYTDKGVRDVYACPFESCHHTSTEHSNLKAHMRTHTGERPYSCSAAGCHRDFRWKSSLTYHEKARHATIKPFRCGCRKQFVEKRKFKMHIEMCAYGTGSASIYSSSPPISSSSSSSHSRYYSSAMKTAYHNRQRQ